MNLTKLATIVALAFCPAILWAQDNGRAIVVSGIGQVAAEPDMAVVSIGVTREALRAGDAMADTSRAVEMVLATLTDAGIEPRDVQTSSIGLSPRWDHSDRNASPRVVGYVASNALSIRVRDLAALGGLLDEVIGSGVNQMNGLSFTLANPRPTKDEARVKAVEDAIAKARLMAQAAKVTLGPIRSITEGGGNPSVVRQFRREALSADVPIAGGEVDISATVT
ncbi:SIMPL domain-containing protein, partial [Rhodobacteraceae bacterium]|nr:SIMPL domain-containing protein [Paracoccaceae bacterium]